MSVCVYLSFEAFNSNTASLNEAPSRVRERQRMLVVFPVPGGPYATQEGVESTGYGLVYSTPCLSIFTRHHLRDV